MSSRSTSLEKVSAIVGICALAASILSAIAAYLAIPEFREFVRERVLQQTGVLYEEPRPDSASLNNFAWVDASAISRAGLLSISDSFTCITGGPAAPATKVSPPATVPVKLGKARDYAVELRMSLDAMSVPYALGVFVRTGYDVIFGSQSASAAAPIGITIQARDVERPRTLTQRALPLDSREHVYRIEVRGNEVKVFIDGNFALSATDEQRAYSDAGTTGLWCSNVAFTLSGVRVVKVP
jgi:hypothetical protein